MTLTPDIWSRERQRRSARGKRERSIERHTAGQRRAAMSKKMVSVEYQHLLGSIVSRVHKMIDSGQVQHEWDHSGNTGNITLFCRIIKRDASPREQLILEEEKTDSKS